MIVPFATAICPAPGLFQLKGLVSDGPVNLCWFLMEVLGVVIPLLWALLGEQCAHIGCVGVCVNHFYGVSRSVTVFYGILLCIRKCRFLDDFLFTVVAYYIGIGSVCGVGDLCRLRNDLPISWVVVAVI